MSIIMDLIKTVCWLTLFMVFMYAFLTHFVLWLEWRLTQLKKAGPLGIRWQAFLASFSIEYLCVVLNIILYPFRSTFSNPKPVPDFRDASKMPVLFVHGYLHHPVAWFFFIRHLKKISESRPTYCINLTPVFASIAELATLVQTKVRDIQAETGAPQVILIGHSMGGLVSAYYTEYLANATDVAKVITLGSAFQGTRMAALGYGKNAQEMSPHSSFLVALLKRVKHSGIPYCSVASKIDNLVIPWQSALVEGPNHQHLILEDHGHLRLLFSPVVIEQVAKWMTR